jgi:ERCC4-related helicase
MCQSLRTTKEQMIDFVRGKPIPESSKVNTFTVGAKPMATSTDVTVDNTKLPHKEPLKEQVNQPSAKGFFIRQNSGGSSNPYSKTGIKSKNSITNAENPHPKDHDRSNSSPTTNVHGSDPIPQLQDAVQMSSNFQITENGRKRNAAPTNETSHRPKARLKNVPALLPMPKRSNIGKPAYEQAKPRVLSLPYVSGPVPFDESTLSHWIYPIHPKYAKREYQVEMSQSALFENTLVSLPTGLGKTMIAAVVLYNYYRWFPEGKLVFCAPTLPLVEQQAKAIHDIVGIPVSDTALLTGNVKAEERIALWDNRRLFFCTAQTIENDMKKMAIDASKVVCLVLDEVHKATGEHSYVQVVRLLREAEAKFRVVGLSATPGSKIETVQHVVTTLGVSRIECRSNDDPDIQKYMHNRAHEIITVEVTSLATGIRDDILELLKAPLKRLQQNGFLKNAASGATISPYSVLTEQKRFHEGLKTGDPRYNPNLSLVFQEAHKLVSWRELIVSYGIGRLRESILDTRNDPKNNRLKHLIESEGLKKIWRSVQGAVENTQGGANVEELLVQNPKLLKLKELLKEHFERARAVGTRAAETRAIVFSQLRGSVREIVTALDPLQPLVRPSRFVGQGKGSRGKESTDEGNGITDEMLKGMNQAEQNRVLEKFRDGFYNVLVCTSIGEEGYVKFCISTGCRLPQGTTACLTRFVLRSDWILAKLIL